FAFRNNFNLGLTLNTLVFDGSYFAGLRAARVFKDYVSQQLLSTEQTVKNQVIEAYLPALLVDESLVILKKDISNLEKILMETRETYKAGFVEQLDVDRLDLSLANLMVEKSNLERQKQLAINSLKYTMGFPMNQELEVVDDLATLLEEATNEQLAGNINFYNRPEYKVAEYGIRLSELNIDLYKAGYLPVVNAFASYQYGYQGNQLFRGEDGFWVPTALAGLRVNIPIFDGFEKRAKIDRAKIGLANARRDKTELERVITLEVTNARTQYNEAQEQLSSQEKNLALAEKIYNTTKVKYREGVGSSLELTQAEQALYQTQQNKVQAMYQLLLAKKRLEIALGN
ncbi:MAG: TolC family protein, partial [Bacteroidota bacterium]